MRRVVLAVMTTLSAVVLLFGYKTSTGATATAAPLTSSSTAPATTGTGGDPTTPSTTSPSPSPSPSTSPSTVTPSTAPSTSAPTTAPTTTSAASGTYDGSVASTRWGDVQVEITVSGGKITAAKTLTVPSGNGRDVEINDYAVPILNSEVVQAQSAKIDTVSGATVTSDGYLTSLQSALDKAGL